MIDESSVWERPDIFALPLGCDFDGLRRDTNCQAADEVAPGGPAEMLQGVASRERTKHCAKRPDGENPFTGAETAHQLPGGEDGQPLSPCRRAGRAAFPSVGVQGAVLVSQDGHSVHYRKICSKCGCEDNCRSTMLISTGITRSHFFCPKCRKSREVQIQGTVP